MNREAIRHYLDEEAANNPDYSECDGGFVVYADKLTAPMLAEFGACGAAIRRHENGFRIDDDSDT